MEAKRELKTGAWRMEKIKLKATRGVKNGFLEKGKNKTGEIRRWSAARRLVKIKPKIASENFLKPRPKLHWC